MLLKDQINLWRERFYGRQDIFGHKRSFYSIKKKKIVSQYLQVFRDKYKSGDSRKGKKFASASELYVPLGDNHIENHIKGVMELLIYVLQFDGTTYFAAIDFDLKHTFKDVLKVKKAIQSHGIKSSIARSTKKGHHIYIFFDGPVEAQYVTSYVNHLYEEIGFQDQLRQHGIALPETFPKTIDLRNITSPGLGIKPPMHGTGMENNQNCWVDDENLPIGGSGESPEQWEYFKDIPINSVIEFKDFLEKSKIKIEKIRMSEKRGPVAQLDYARMTPYVPPEDGDLSLVIKGCPAMKRLWEGPSQDMNNDSRVAILSWALRTKNGLDMLREKWNFSDEAEKQIEFGIETGQKPWSCRALQEHGVCVRGKDPVHTSGEFSTLVGEKLSDFCFKKVPPRETIHGKVVTNPKELPERDWADPSPIRLRVPFNPEGAKKLKDQIDALDKKDENLGDSISGIYHQIVGLKDAKSRKEVIDHLKSKKVAKVAELKGFEKEAKEAHKLEKERDLDTGDGIKSINGIRYTTLDSVGYATLDVNKDGDTVISEISNFEIIIEKDIRIHSVLNGSIKELKGAIVTAKGRSAFKILTIDWNSNSKLAAAIGESASNSASFRAINLDRIREAANFFGIQDVERIDTYEDYGFDDYLKPTIFRSSYFNITNEGPVLTGDHVDMSRQEFAKDLGAEDISKEDFQKTVHIIKNDLLNMQDPMISYTILAHSFQAAIHNAYIPFREAPVLWVQGTTGAAKSTFAFYAQTFHGRFPRLLNVNSTMRNIEFNSMLFKDALLVIDDYKEGFHHNTTIKLVQSFYDRSSRGKQNKDGSSAVGTSCRGLIMFTAEDRPSSEASTLARCLYIEAPSVIDTKKNDQRKLRVDSVVKDFPGVLGRFIHFMLHNYPDPEALADRFWNYTGTLKSTFRGRQNSHRIAQNFAANYLTWELFLEFMEANGLLAQDEKHEYEEVHWKTVTDLCSEMVEVCSQEQASNVFLNTLKELVGSGKYYIEGLGTNENKNATKLGFVGEIGSGKVYLFSGPSVGAVKSQLKGQGGGMSHSVGAIGKQLIQDKLIANSTSGRHQTRKSYQGAVHYVWELDGLQAGLGASVREVNDNDAGNHGDAPKRVDMTRD